MIKFDTFNSPVKMAKHTPRLGYNPRKGCYYKLNQDVYGNDISNFNNNKPGLVKRIINFFKSLYNANRPLK